MPATVSHCYWLCVLARPWTCSFSFPCYLNSSLLLSSCNLWTYVSWWFHDNGTGRPSWWSAKNVSHRPQSVLVGKKCRRLSAKARGNWKYICAIIIHPDSVPTDLPLYHIYPYTESHISRRSNNHCLIITTESEYKKPTTSVPVR